MGLGPASVAAGKPIRAPADVRAGCGRQSSPQLRSAPILPASPPRRLAGEALGTAFLLATVVGSGIMGETLAGGNVALALLGNMDERGFFDISLSELGQRLEGRPLPLGRVLLGLAARRSFCRQRWRRDIADRVIERGSCRLGGASIGVIAIVSRSVTVISIVAAGVRVIAVDRPGIGRSDRNRAGECSTGPWTSPRSRMSDSMAPAISVRSLSSMIRFSLMVSASRGLSAGPYEFSYFEVGGD